MKRQHTGLLPAAAARVALLLLLAAATPAAFGQAREAQPHRPPPEPSYDPVRRPPGIRERQLQMEEMSREMNKGAARPRKSEELRMTEIAEDYRDLQQVNNKMMSAVMSAASPDYKLVVTSVADIRRRAERLRENLALPPPAAEGEAKPEPKPAEDAAGMKAALLALDRSIMSFVRSPLFKNTDVLDAEAAAKAGRDLADVIERSRLAGRDAERLGKQVKN